MRAQCRHILEWLRATAIVLAVTSAPGAGLADTLADKGPVAREILALYDGAQEGAAERSRIHRYAELPLNHLGYILRFHDIRDGLPEPATVGHYRAVLTWFAGVIPNGAAYLAWAGQIARTNLRYIVLGDVGTTIDSNNIAGVNRLLRLTGVRHTGDYVSPTVMTRVVRRDPGLIEFECHLDPVLPAYPVIDTASSATRVGLALATPPEDGRRRTTLVAIGSKGGFAALNFEFCHQRPPLFQGRWLIDPFAFFRAALGDPDGPIPDTTTMSGRRLYFGQLESTGWTRSSKIEGFQENGSMAAEAVVQELIEPFGDLPMALVLLPSDIAKSGRIGKLSEQIVERALASPAVSISKRRLRSGLSRFDIDHPSISSLLPLSSAGPERQIYAPLSGDDAPGSAGPSSEASVRTAAETIANTEWPRRLKPFTLDYHAVAGEDPARLLSNKTMLNAAQAAPVTPITADRYAAIVDGFFSARIERIGATAWRISGRGALQTLRFDAAEDRTVDLAASTGVIGQVRHATSLYVALDQAVEPAEIVLRAREPGSIIQTRFGLNESRWLVRHVVDGDCAVNFEARGFGAGAFSWSTPGANHYLVAVSRAGRELWRTAVDADAAGKLDFAIPIRAIEPLHVRIACADHHAASQ